MSQNQALEKHYYQTGYQQSLRQDGQILMVSPEAFINDFWERLSLQVSRPILCNVPKSIIEQREPVSIIECVSGFKVLQQQ